MASLLNKENASPEELGAGLHATVPMGAEQTPRWLLTEESPVCHRVLWGNMLIFTVLERLLPH